MWQCLYKILEISSKLWKNASQIHLMNWNIRVFNVGSDTGQWAARKKIAVPATAYYHDIFSNYCSVILQH